MRETDGGKLYERMERGREENNLDGENEGSKRERREESKEQGKMEDVRKVNEWERRGMRKRREE